MSTTQPQLPVITSCCTACGTIGLPAVYAWPDDRRLPLALCSRCARDPAQLRADPGARVGAGAARAGVGRVRSLRPPWRARWNHGARLAFTGLWPLVGHVLAAKEFGHVLADRDRRRRR